MTWLKRLPDIAATLWFLLLMTGVVSAGIILASRIPITGSVTAEMAIQYVIRPLIYVIGAILLVISYIASIELFGRSETDGAITRIVRLIQDAGAARELREHRDELRQRQVRQRKGRQRQEENDDG